MYYYYYILTLQIYNRYGFSTDLPTTCLAFGVNSRTVLVATDKVYEIGLENFEVREFVDPSVAPSVFANNKLVDIFPLDGRNEYLLCFQAS